MTIPDEAFHAAIKVLYYANPHDVTAALTAALPFLQGVKVDVNDIGNTITDKTVKRRIADALEYVWSALDCDVEHIESIIAHMHGNGLRIVETGITVSDAGFNIEVGIPTTEISTAARMEVIDGLPELLERLDAGLEYEGDLETENDHIELFNTEAAQELFADAATAIRSLSSPSPREQALEEAAQAAENAVLSYNIADCAGLADWKAFEAGQENGLKHAAAAIRALSSQPVADGWLPIDDDTPKDTVVLLSWKYKGNWEYEAGLYGSTRGGWLHGQATHWRPLPASPGASDTRPTGGSDD